MRRRVPPYRTRLPVVTSRPGYLSRRVVVREDIDYFLGTHSSGSEGSRRRCRLARRPFAMASSSRGGRIGPFDGIEDSPFLRLQVRLGTRSEARRPRTVFQIGRSPLRVVSAGTT